jgi:hypothetical protein
VRVDRCPNAGRYLARRPPKCGRTACRLKWIEARVEYLVAREESRQQREQYEREAWL